MIVFVCGVIFLMESGYGEVNDVRNWKYERYFLTMGLRNIILRILDLRKNDENDSVFLFSSHCVTAIYLQLKNDGY